MTTPTKTEKEIVEKWRKNAKYLAKHLKQENYKDIERHFEDLVGSAVNETLTHHREVVEREERERAEHIIHLILPLAKGYAAANRVGSNSDYVQAAEEYLEALTENNQKET